MRKRKIIAGVMILLLVCIAGCGQAETVGPKNTGNEKTSENVSNQTNEKEGNKENTSDQGNEETQGNETEAEAVGSDYHAFIDNMTVLSEFAEEAENRYFPVHSEYFGSMAAAGISSFRYAVEYVLWLKGEGDDLASFTKESRYTDWATIAELNYASPYPPYFEGLIYQFQGKMEEAADHFADAMIIPTFPKEGIDFNFLKTMSVTDLYTILEELHSAEDTVYSVYTPTFGYQRDFRNYSSEYLRNLSKEALVAGDYESAYEHAKMALKAEPGYVENWRNACFCAACLNEWRQVGAYLDEGLAMFPEDEKLRELEAGIRETAAQ